MNKLETLSIKKEILVDASQAAAFKTFTEKIDLWWPRTHHTGKSPLTEVVLEPGLNGRWYTKHEDGTEKSVGYVLKWDPNALLVLVWQINGDFEFDADLITEVEVHFIDEGPKKTKVKFEHKDLDKLKGGKADSMDDGWAYILDRYKNTVDQS